MTNTALAMRNTAITRRETVDDNSPTERFQKGASPLANSFMILGRDHLSSHSFSHTLTHSLTLSLYACEDKKHQYNIEWERGMDQNLLKEPGYKAWTSSIHDMYQLNFGVFIVGCRSQLSAWLQDLHRHLFDLPKAILYRWTVVVLMGLCGQMHQNIVIKSVILKIRDKAIARC